MPAGSDNREYDKLVALSALSLASIITDNSLPGWTLIVVKYSESLEEVGDWLLTAVILG